MEYTWGVRVVGQEQGVRIHCRNRSWTVGAPLSFDSEYAEATALESCLGALAADLVGGFQTRAKKMRIDIVNIEAQLSCELQNPLRYLDVVGESGTPAIKRIAGQVYIDTFADSEVVQTAWQRTLDLSPLFQTLQAAIEFDVQCAVV